MNNKTKDVLPLMITLFWAFISVDELLCGYYRARYFRLFFLLVIMLYIMIYYNGKRFQKDHLAMAWGITIIPTLYSIAFNVNITNIEYLVVYSFSIIMLFAKINSLNTLEKMFKIIEVIGLFHAAGIVLEKIFPALFAKYIYTRYPAEMFGRLTHAYYMTGFQREVAFVSAYIIAALGVCIYYNKSDLINRFKIVFLIIALMLTNKRAFTLFPVMAIIIEYSIWHKLRINKKLITSCAGMIIVVVISCIVFKDKIEQMSIVQRITSTMQAAEKGEDVMTGRGVLWDASFQLFLQKPVLGIGWRKTEDLIRLIVYSRIPLSTHNIYIQLLTETGAVGIIIYMRAFLNTLKLSIKYDLNPYNTNSDYDFTGIVRYSLFYQLFFFLYGITGVNYVDRPFFVMLIISIFFVINAKRITSQTKVDI